MNSAIDEPSENEEEAGNDTTRCICGSQDYPGPPTTDENKALSEESGSFFIQCDKCNVWQHGGCVGIMAEEDSPDNYSCEQCEKRLHQLHTDQKGQRFSLYLPVVRRIMPNVRKVSMSRGDQDVKLKKEREILARLGADLSGPKRRSTMNSRQNYDEEEMLRKAIEESKGEADTEPRKTKRLRDESEDGGKPHIKRQRTGSDSIEAASTRHTGSIDADSDDDAPQTKSAMKRARAAAAETQRQRELREREKLRDQQREEAAGRRKERAGRRRADEADLDEHTLDQDEVIESNPAASQPDSPPPPNIEVTQPSSSHKRTEKSRRTARNQYTKDRDTSPPPGKNGGSSSSGDDVGKKSASNVKQSPLVANSEPMAAAPTSAPQSKTKGRSHKAKGAASSTAAGSGTLSKADSSGSEKGKKSVPPPISQINQQVASMQREVLQWEAELRERASRFPEDASPHETLRMYGNFKAAIEHHRSKWDDMASHDPNRLSANTLAGIGLGVS